MEIDVDATLLKFKQIGIDVDGVQCRTNREKILFINRILDKRTITPVYLCTPDRNKTKRFGTELSQPIRINENNMPVSRIIEEQVSVYELRSRFKFDFEKGEIYDAKSFLRVDRIHHFKQNTRFNSRYMQVSISIRGLQGKLAAHRMIWAAYHNRWPEAGMVIDHEDRNSLNNAITNLKEVPQSENVRNKGVPRVATDFNGQLARRRATQSRPRHIPALRK